MPSAVRSSVDAAEALAACEGFLAIDPIAHNVALSILHERVATPADGRYWWVEHDGHVASYAWQSPPTFFAGVVPASREDVGRLAEAVFDDVPRLPGVVGDAATAAAFAGRWTELSAGSAAPVEAQRIYELVRVEPVPACDGELRPARPEDLELVTAWVRGFNTETGMEHADADLENTVRRRIESGRFSVWQTSEPVAMCLAVAPVGDVTRIGMVYTPPEHRGRGYASVMVAQVSLLALQRSSRCVLYTQLSNPSSNRIYRRIGYSAVAEVMSYRLTASNA